MGFRDITPFNVRFPAHLKEKLREAANAKTGSINAEVIERVASTFEKRNELKDFTDGELIQELLDRYGRDGIFIRIGKENV